MKRRLVSLLLALVLAFGLLPVTVLADWTSFRGSSDNMGITKAQTPIDPDFTTLRWAATLGTPPQGKNTIYVSQPVLSGEYIYVVAGEKLYKLSAADGSIEQEITLAGKDSNGLTQPAISGNLIVIALDDGRILAYNKNSLELQWRYDGTAEEQGASPVLISDGRVYTGFWKAETGEAHFVCLNATNGEELWSHTQPGGFYWAGAVEVGNYIFVGTDDGTDKNTVGTSNILSFQKETGAAGQTLALENCGDLRSSLAYKDGRIYFTTKGGYLCSAAVDGKTGAITDLKKLKNEFDGVVCEGTSTPVVYNGYIYYGVGKTKGYFVVAKETGDGLERVNYLQLKGKSQGSPLLTTAYGDDLYFYTTYNKTPGGLSCIKVPGGDPMKAELIEIYDAKGYEQSCTASPICDEDGTIYYRNDSGNLFAVSRTAAPAAIIDTQPVGAKYNPGTAAAEVTALTVAAHVPKKYQNTAEIGFQWQKRTNGVWVNIPGATEVSYKPVIPGTIDGVKQVDSYRCVVKTTLEGATAEAYSDTAEITIQDLSGDTTFYYAINESNTRPDGTSSDSKIKRDPIAVTETSTYIDMKKALEDKMYGTSQGPRIWIMPPKNGKIVSITATAQSEGDKLPSKPSTAPAASAYEYYYYLSGAKEGLHGKVTITVTVQAEDRTEKTYQLLLVPNDSDIPKTLTQTVYATIAVEGEVVLAQKELVITEEDGEISVDDVLRAAHKEFYKDGEDGYASGETQYGLSVTKLWGDTSGAFSYWNENASCMSAADAVSENGHVVAFVYKDQTYWSDSYAKFGSFDYEASTHTELNVTLTTAGYDGNWNTVFEPCAGATITAYEAGSGATGTEVTSGFAFEDAGDGQYTVTFQDAGEYYLVAKNESANIVPAVCTVTVTSDDEELNKILEQIDALGNPDEIEPDEETYEEIQKIKRAIRKLKDENNREWAENALAEKTEKFDELLNKAKAEASTTEDNQLSRIYDEVVKKAEEEDPNLITEASKKDLNAIMAEAEDDISRANHTGEINRILKQAKTDMENVLRQIHVSFRLIGDFRHDEDGEEHTEYVTWIETKRYAVNRNATVKDLFQQAIAAAKLDETGSDDGYVSSVRAPEVLGGYWLSEMDNGAKAGWMYMVNGEYPDDALTEFELEDGDKVVWHYIDDYTDEEDLAAARRAADISPKDYAKDRLGKIVTVTGKGSVEPELDFADIGTDVTFTFVPDENQELVEVLVDGESVGKPETYTYEDLTVKSRIKAVFTGKMRFEDVRRKDWFYEDVEYVVENGLFHGTSKTTFSPNAPMTRGMLVTVLYRLADKPETTAASGFTDVAKEQYYAAPIAWAAENGIVSGMSQTRFAPDEQVTREQLAAILYRFAQKQGYGTGKTNDLSGYADAKAISAYAAEALGWANAEKLVNGRSETELSPQGQATRAEVAAILHRFAETVAK